MADNNVIDEATASIQTPTQTSANTPIQTPNQTSGFDYSSPYYLNSSDNPCVSLVSQKLTNENYLSWKRSMKVALAAKNKLCFVDGMLVRPQMPLSHTIAWERCNNIILSWLLNSVTSDIANSISCSENVREIWLDLEKRFSQGNANMSSTGSSDSTGKCEELLIDIINSQQKPAQWHGSCCIYRVPKKLVEINKQAYTPKLISIGPLHHDNEELKEMEMLKKRYFKEFYNRWEFEKDRARIHASIIAEKEEEIRHCYSEISKLGTEKYVKMIMLDAIFIIELFLRNSSDSVETDYILSKPCLRVDIEHDLMLLENQLPFFVLEELYTSAFGNSSISGQKTEDFAFLTLARRFFHEYDNCQCDHTRSITSTKINHFTDLVRYFFYPPAKTLPQETEVTKPSGRICNLLCGRKTKVTEPPETNRNLYCATKLYDAGVKFKVHDEDQGYSLDIKFKKGEYCSYLNCLPCLKWIRENTQPASLKLRQIVVDDRTEYVYRNLMALEQFHYPDDAYICSYILLLDSLINSEEDVSLLVHKKVIVNWLGSDDEVATLFNKLGRDIMEGHPFYSNVSKQLNRHYNNSWNRNRRALSKVYFRDIWRGTATVAGILVLLFTFGSFLTPLVKE